LGVFAGFYLGSLEPGPGTMAFLTGINPISLDEAAAVRRSVRRALCLCRRHHRLKAFGGWLLESFDDGSCRWTSPGGQIFDVPANRYLDTG
jgi:hypothetical protein